MASTPQLRCAPRLYAAAVTAAVDARHLVALERVTMRGAWATTPVGPRPGNVTAMRVDAVIFDMDGTLLDSSRTVPSAYAAAIHELCGRRVTDAEVIAEYGSGPACALLGRFIGRQATDSDVDCWLRHLDARLTQTVTYPGVGDAIERLASGGVHLAVFTGATTRAAERQLAHGGLRSRFGAVVGSDEVAAVKPAPDGLYRACELLDVAPSRTAYVGDAINDLRCARAAGAVPVAAAWGHLYEHDREPHLVAHSPDHVVDMLLGLE